MLVQNTFIIWIMIAVACSLAQTCKPSAQDINGRMLRLEQLERETVAQNRHIRELQRKIDFLTIQPVRGDKNDESWYNTLRKEVEGFFKQCVPNNETLFDAMLEYTVKNYPESVVRDIWLNFGYTALEDPLDCDTAIFRIVNFQRRTVERLKMAMPDRTEYKDKDRSKYHYHMHDIYYHKIVGLPPQEKTPWGMDLRGDFDGDGVLDSLDVRQYYNNEYYNNQYYQSKRIPIFPNENGYSSPNSICGFYNHGDLDGDGGDELGVHSCRFTLGWYVVWTLKNGKWGILIETPLTLDARYTGIKLVEKHPTKEGYAYVRGPATIGFVHNTVFFTEELVNLKKIDCFHNWYNVLKH
jgi:hypothetical protein